MFKKRRRSFLQESVATATMVTTATAFFYVEDKMVILVKNVEQKSKKR